MDVHHCNQTLDPSARLLNGLGITEAGGNVTFGEVPRDLAPAALAPVGRVVEGIDARILPDNGQVEQGELVVRSVFLAAGYVRGRENHAFHDHDDGTTSFRTGDLVRRRQDGTIVHLGRRDQVVQVNGVSVSLSEVEAALQHTPGIEAACVVLDAGTSDRARLLAALKVESPIRPSEVRSRLEGALEVTKIPELFYRLESFPILPGGKIDRGRLLSQLSAATPMREESPQAASNLLEVQLLAVWRRVLRVPEVGVEDSVLEQGADSLRVVEVVSLLGQLGISLTSVELYTHPTVAELSSYLAQRDPGSVSRASPVVLLKEGHGDVNLFVIPGAGSGVLALCDLAQSLPESVTVYGLQYPGIDDDEPYRTSVSDLAEYFLDHIEARSLQGPYAIAGTSFGGMVAFEMAGRLERSGRPVSLVGLIDTYGPRYLSLSTRWWRAPIKALKRWVAPVGQECVWTIGTLASGLRQKWTFLRAGIWLRGARRRRRPQALRFQYLMKACFMASGRYVVHPLESVVHFFSVEEQLPAELFGRDEALGWGAASRAGVRVIRIPGRHGTHIRPPHVEVLGEKLGRAVMESGGGRLPARSGCR